MCRSWLRHCATSLKVAVSIADGVQPHYGPGIDSSSNRNEYQKYFLGGGVRLRVRWANNLTAFMRRLS